MEVFTTEMLQMLLLQIPNFAGFIVLSAVLWNINNRLLDMLKAELEDCRDNREREQVMLMRPPVPTRSASNAGDGYGV